MGGPKKEATKSGATIDPGDKKRDRVAVAVSAVDGCTICILLGDGAEDIHGQLGKNERKQCEKEEQVNRGSVLKKNGKE